MQKKTVVLYPGVGVGHLAPMLELAKAFLRHGGDQQQLDVAIVVFEPPVYANGFAATVARAKASNTSVSIHVLPPPPPPASSDAEPEEPLARLLRFLRATNAPLRDFLRELSESRGRVPQAIVLDMFCADALDVAAELGIPAYFFFPSGASGLACFLGLPAMRARVGGTSFTALGDSAVLSFPGVPPLTVADLPQGLAGNGEACRGMMRAAARMLDARGILVNSFESLEPRAVRALRDGLCVPDRATPPVYCVGPMVSPGGDKDDHHGCLRWMDKQPDRSVVFLCFGSMGAFPKKQLEEIAVGLERSGQRFLWVVRGPPGADDDVGALLPAGFQERTEDRGLVVKNWAPQVDVLRHRAAGAFMTHCGWNSTLEGVVAGLPLLCWPLYAEQRMNRVRIVEDMKLGAKMRKDDDGVVTAEEVEAKVRWVMEDSDGARALRERAAAARDQAAEALAEGGPSHVAFLEFLESMLASEGMVNV